MTRDEALDKIKKCLALSSSANEHEAAAALRQAQKLMARFNLVDADVALSEVAEVRQRAQNAPLVSWEVELASLIANAFGVEHYTSTTWLPSKSLQLRRHRYFVFVGVGAAPEVAGYAFDLLARQCAKSRRAHMAAQSKNCKPKTKVARGDLFAHGWVDGVSDKVERFAGSKKNTELIMQYMRDKYPDIQRAHARNRVTGKNVTTNDWHRGAQAGRSAELNHGLTRNGSEALIEGPQP